MQAPAGPNSPPASRHDPAVVLDENASAPATNTARSRSAMPSSSRTSGDGGRFGATGGATGAGSGLALPVRAELRDLAVLVDRDNGVGIHGRADDQVLCESGLGEGASMRRFC